MERSRFTEEQIIGVLREQEAGLSVAEAMLDNAVLKDITARKWCRPPLAEPLWRLRAKRTTSASGGPVQSSEPIAARCVTGTDVRMMPRRARD